MVRILVAALALMASGVGAQSTEPKTAPSPLLLIDQHRQSVVDGIVATWQEALLAKHGASAGQVQAELHARLMTLRADRLLAASLAGSYATMEVLIGETQAEISPVARTHLKALGDANADLAYTPVNPCRIVDTRIAGGALVPNTAQTFDGFNASSFAAQGGTASNCGMPNGVAAMALNVIAVNPTNLGFIKVWAANGSEPAVSTVNYQIGITAIATGTIVPVDSANSNRFIAKSPAGVHFVADVVGYFRAPSAGNYFVQGGNSLGTTAALGTKDNNALNIIVNNARVMRYEPNAVSPNVIGGHPSNSVIDGAHGATIGGGGMLTDPNAPAASPNRISDHYGTVGGGAGNVAGDSNGIQGSAFATVGGGRNNVAAKYGSVVAGGDGNMAGDRAAVGGGTDNVAPADFSAVGGGTDNSANASWSAIAGGTNNTAAGVAAVIGGGSSNTANGSLAVVPGGFQNSAQGPNSFAAGSRAKANLNGCFVWSDNSSGNNTSCFGNNEFIARALGGFYFFTGGSSDATYTGAQLPAGASAWSAYSDRAGKDNIEPVDAVRVLERLSAIPIATWNWKTQDASVRHMGPMAQDFRAAFGLGESDRAISTVDGDGVALAAIQGLNLKLEKTIARQSRLIEGLQRRLDALERR